MNAPAPATITAAATLGQRVESIALNAIAPSTTHIQTMRRKRFDKALLQELADSIKGTQGVIQPIVLRPHPKPSPLVQFEIVAGERRWVATGMAAFDSILAVVRDLDDEQVLEIQLVENLQREGLHEMEEAEGYHELMKLKKLTADQVADKIGKSRRYVFNRLKLLDLSPEARKAFYAGEVSASVALYLARIAHHETQRQALKDMMDQSHHNGGDPITARDALELIHERYMLALKDAPFDVKVVYFYPVLPKGSARIGVPCGECPKRTGAQPELFADVKSADVCTDPKCFAAKRDAANALRITEAQATGQKVITGKEAKAIFPYSHSESPHGDWIGAGDHYYELSYQKTIKQLLGKDLPEPCLAMHPSSGRLIEVYSKAAIKKAAAAAGIKPQRSASGSSGRDKAAELKTRIEVAARVRILAAIRVANRTRTFGLEDLKLIALELFDRLGFDGQKRLVDVLNAEAGIPKPPRAKGGQDDYVHAYATKIAALPAEQLGVLLFDLVLIGECSPYGDGGALTATATRLKIDGDKIRATVKAEITEREQAKKPAKKATKK